MSSHFPFDLFLPPVLVKVTDPRQSQKSSGISLIDMVAVNVLVSEQRILLGLKFIVVAVTPKSPEKRGVFTK